MTVEIISWSISTKVWVGIELATPGSAVRLASVARHPTYCATRPWERESWLLYINCVLNCYHIWLLYSVLCLFLVKLWVWLWSVLLWHLRLYGSVPWRNDRNLIEPVLQERKSPYDLSCWWDVKHQHNNNIVAFPAWSYSIIAPDKDWRQLGIYPPLFGLIGYFKF